MRNPERIPMLIDKLKEVWLDYPDLRFWQLLMMVFEELPEDLKRRDPFFFEDNVWSAAIDSLKERFKDV